MTIVVFIDDMLYPAEAPRARDTRTRTEKIKIECLICKSRPQEGIWQLHISDYSLNRVFRSAEHRDSRFMVHSCSASNLHLEKVYLLSIINGSTNQVVNVIENGPLALNGGMIYDPHQSYIFFIGGAASGNGH